MKPYKVTITEKLQMTVEVEAENRMEQGRLYSRCRVLQGRRFQGCYAREGTRCAVIHFSDGGIGQCFCIGLASTEFV